MYEPAGVRFEYGLADAEGQNGSVDEGGQNVPVPANDVVATGNVAVVTGVNQYLFEQLVF